MFSLFTSLKAKKLKVELEVQKHRESLMIELRDEENDIRNQIRQMRDYADSERTRLNKEVEQLAISCAKDRADYEHEYHSRMEELGINIAKLEAREETLKNDEVTYLRMIDDRDKEILRQQEIINSLLEKLG